MIILGQIFHLVNDWYDLQRLSGEYVKRVHMVGSGITVRISRRLFLVQVYKV